MKPITVRLSFTPPRTTAQQKGERIVGRHILHYKKRGVKEAERVFLALLAPCRPPLPYDGPLGLDVVVEWPWRSSETAKRRALGKAWHDTKPDLSNWIKIFEDCLVTSGYLVNDSRISRLRVSKLWGDTPGVRFTLWVLESDDARNMGLETLDSTSAPA